jgi:hypothetical protein
MSKKNLYPIFVCFCLTLLHGCAPGSAEKDMTAKSSSDSTHTAQSVISTADASRVEYKGLVATIEHLRIDNGKVVVDYHIQQLPSCSWLLKPQVSGLVRFYNAKKQLLGDGVRISVRLNFERLRQGLPSQMVFTVDFPNDASFVTVWYGVDEFETRLCPLPFPNRL